MFNHWRKNFLLICLLLFVFITANQTFAANVDLAPLVTAGGSIVLNPANTYYLNNETWFSSDTTIQGNGATITLYAGPLKSSGPHHITIDNCNITATNSWAALAFQSKTIAVVIGGFVSSSGNSAIFVADSNLTISDTEIKNSSFGINSDAYCIIDLTNVSIHDCDMSYLQKDGISRWHGGNVVQSGGAAINFSISVSADMSGTQVTMSQKDSIAIQFLSNSTGALHGVIINGVSHGVLAEQNSVLLDKGCDFTCPFPYLPDGTGGAGAGIASQKGGALIVRDSLFTGFLSAVMVANWTPHGTADVENCTFNDTEVSAFQVANAKDVRFYNNECNDTKQDTIYMANNSTGVIERNRVFNPLNSGFTVSNCSGGVWIKDNYLVNVVHQSIAIVNNCDNVYILGNTLVGGTIANIYMDSTSKAKITGNICHNTPDYNIRFGGSQGPYFAGNLLSQSSNGMEIKDGATATLYLNRISDNSGTGILNYNSTSLHVFSTHFHNNATASSSDYSIFNNLSSTILGPGNRFSPGGSRACYNNAGLNVIFANNYWESVQGPYVNGGGPNTGSLLDWNSSNGSSVTYQPFLTTPSVYSDSGYNISLQPLITTVWNASFGNVSQSFVCKASSPTINNQICGALQCHDLSPIAPYETLPDYTLPGHLFVVWNSYYLCYYAESATLTFHYDNSYTGNLVLYQRQDNGTYIEVDSNQNKPDSTIEYTPSDPFSAHGIFVIVEDVLPKPCFTALPTSGWAPLNVCFSDCSDGNGYTIKGWQWDFTNDGLFESNAQNPCHTYDEPGTYTVVLKVQTDMGIASISKTIVAEYSYPFDNPDAEGWEPLPITGNTFINDPLGSFYIAPTSTITSSTIAVLDKNESGNQYGCWELKTSSALQSCTENYLYRARYNLMTDQTDNGAVPFVRLRWNDVSSLTLAAFHVDKGPNAITTSWRNVDSYFFKNPEDAGTGTNFLIYLDLIDFTPAQTGNIYCNSVDVTRYTVSPASATLVAQFDTNEDFEKWSRFDAGSLLDPVTSGSGSGSLWLESPGPLETKHLNFGGWGLDYNADGPKFEAGHLYCAVFTLRSENQSARIHLPMIRMRFSNKTYDWNGMRYVRQVPGTSGQMPAPGGTTYSIFIQSPPYLSGVHGDSSDLMALDFDIVDGEATEYGRVYLDKVQVYRYPLP